MSLETAEGPAVKARAASVAPLPPLPPHWRSLQRAFVRQARSAPGRPAVFDSTKAKLNYGETFLRACVLARALKRLIGPEKYVGLFLPPTVPSAVANIAVALLGRVPVNLNYTAGQDSLDSSISQCGIKHVITARKAVEKFNLAPKADLIYLEDVPKSLTAIDKAWGAFVAKVVPIGMLGAFLPGLKGDSLDDIATVIFTSGSTGNPKGVVLSERNVLSNIHQVNNHINLLPDEVVLGVLPFFHSYGFTFTLWTVLCLGKKVIYHFNPLDARIVGDICETHGVTLIAGTPTFFRTYLKKCGKEQFAKLVHLILGAEKLPTELNQEIKDKLGVEPLEGYGCTELSPVVSVNVTQEITLPDGRKVPGNRVGTVGRPFLGTAIKTTNPETGGNLPEGETGEVNVKGPQVMVGYLNRPDLTAKVVKDGWYATGDLGYMDEDGFLRITGRISRFSKIGGEMVPHEKIESAIEAAIGHGTLCKAVTALPDPKRGERLYVIYTDEMGMEPSEVVRRLQATPMPKLWIPSAEDFIKVNEVPILGSGKVALGAVWALVAERKGG